jgi:hypothetical protein
LRPIQRSAARVHGIPWHHLACGSIAEVQRCSNTAMIYRKWPQARYSDSARPHIAFGQRLRHCVAVSHGSAGERSGLARPRKLRPLGFRSDLWQPLFRCWWGQWPALQNFWQLVLVLGRPGIGNLVAQIVRLDPVLAIDFVAAPAEPVGNGIIEPLDGACAHPGVRATQS